VLEQALTGYGGAVVLVTHDRALIDAVATRTWAIEGGSIREVLGGYSDLLRVRDRERRDREREAQREGAAQHRATHGGGSAAPVATSASRELHRLEAEIATVEAELRLVRSSLLDPETFADIERGAAAGRDHDRLSGALAELYERWTALSESA
jgi:ATPase subunit of ABC transporter with duplicated ATPase domains